ncbi:hypothetical protein [Leifsonia sp. LS-T14]|uniref:hypothetical protein n=1 Tax=unclassified Leifsonia TaxID=2663824 RepID=UPI0035A695E3
MPDPRSLVVQSVLYGNDAAEIVRAAEALSHSVGRARDRGLISEWMLQLGDCSPAEALTTADRDAIAAFVQAAGGALEYTFFGENLGSARGHNTLAQKSQTELLLILNPDALVAPDTIEELAGAVTDGVGIAEARQIPLEHPKDFTKATGDTSWASTACALTTRVAFDAVGGFDADTFFLYCDDVDYSWQLRLAGYRVVYEPAARVFHDKRLTVTADWPASSAEVYYSAEAAIFLAYKYSRDDLVERLLEQFRAEGSEAVLKAVAAFESKRDSGALPAQLDPQHSVAEFRDGNYAVHRF